MEISGKERKTEKDRGMNELRQNYCLKVKLCIDLKRENAYFKIIRTSQN